MQFTIQFRGVALYLTKHRDTELTEVLFPNAENTVPIEGSANPLLHADGKPAVPHYARALIPGLKPADAVYRHLNSRVVECLSQSSPTKTATGFVSQFTRITTVTNKPGYNLHPIPVADRTDAVRVATRFLLSGGTATAAPVDAAQPPFAFDSTFSTAAPAPRPYAISAVWTIEADAPLVLAVRHFDGTNDQPIVLDADHPDVFFYNFDAEHPSRADLISERYSVPCEQGIVDHDFKWLYQLMTHKQGTWKTWLGGNNFPAPFWNCSGDVRLAGEVRMMTVDVSTCFPTSCCD